LEKAAVASFTEEIVIGIDEEQGLGDAPWPPSFAKQPGEPKRVQPSRAKKEPD
jgi:hypothetical protein